MLKTIMFSGSSDWLDLSGLRLHLLAADHRGTQTNFSTGKLGYILGLKMKELLHKVLLLEVVVGGVLNVGKNPNTPQPCASRVMGIQTAKISFFAVFRNFLVKNALNEKMSSDKKESF